VSTLSDQIDKEKVEVARLERFASEMQTQYDSHIKALSEQLTLEQHAKSKLTENLRHVVKKYEENICVLNQYIKDPATTGKTPRGSRADVVSADQPVISRRSAAISTKIQMTSKAPRISFSSSADVLPSYSPTTCTPAVTVTASPEANKLPIERGYPSISLPSLSRESRVSPRGLSVTHLSPLRPQSAVSQRPSNAISPSTSEIAQRPQTAMTPSEMRAPSVAFEDINGMLKAQESQKVMFTVEVDSAVEAFESQVKDLMETIPSARVDDLVHMPSNAGQVANVERAGLHSDPNSLAAGIHSGPTESVDASNGQPTRSSLSFLLAEFDAPDDNLLNIAAISALASGGTI
jgi:hypothetical protein